MIKFTNVKKQYNGVYVLDGVNFEIEDGEFALLVGHSGSGKTTIFKLLTRMERVDSGNIIIDNYDIVSLAESKIPILRQNIGIVFQDYKLIPTKTIYENIALTLEVSGMKDDEINDRVHDLLEIIHLSNKSNNYPSQLSGGEKQKVAIARAMSLAPSIILADEPTGNLDPKSTEEINELLKSINNEGTTLLMATHDISIVSKFNGKVITLDQGHATIGYSGNKVQSKSLNEKVKDIETKKTESKIEEYNIKSIENNDELSQDNSSYTEVNEVNVNSNRSNVKLKKSKSWFDKWFTKKDKNRIDQNNEEVVKQDFQNKFFNENSQRDITNTTIKPVNRFDDLKIQDNDLLDLLISSKAKNIDDLMNLNDMELSKIVGITNVWRMRDILDNYNKQI